jgi:hypothetical protein
MTQAYLDLHPRDTPKPGTLCGRVFDVLHANRGRWVDGRRLAEVGGYAGWSARVRELRNHYGYTVENRQTILKYKDGPQVGKPWMTITEYRML